MHPQNRKEIKERERKKGRKREGNKEWNKKAHPISMNKWTKYKYENVIEMPNSLVKKMANNLQHLQYNSWDS